MKLLGWMHRKLRSTESLKEFSIENSWTCLSNLTSLDKKQCYYPQSSYGKAERDNYLQNSFGSLHAAGAEEDYFEEESLAFFHGFLTIGTLGSESINSNPSTPTFSISVDNITEKSTEVTENDLKLINDELEKVLWAEDGCNDSSGRNSHVSTGRSSHCSTITLSGKPLEGTETRGNGATTFPLQGYLLGSAIELPDTTVVKKKHRTSLGELFQRTKIAEECSASKWEMGGKQEDKEKHKSAINLMKKVRKKLVHVSSRTPRTVVGGSVDYPSRDTKLQKILQMFHKKVYPQNSTVAQNPDMPHAKVVENNNEGRYNNSDCMLPDEDIIIFPQRYLSKVSKGSMQCFTSHSNPPQIAISGNDFNGNRECWINTDAEYLVLEL